MATTTATEEDQTNAAERKAQGEFVRPISTARNWIDEKVTETDRYHVYIAYNCPWSHRVTLVRSVLGLEDAITMDVAFPNRTNPDHPQGENKWQFLPAGHVAPTGRLVRFDECTNERVYGVQTLNQVYELAGGVQQKSVPMLFDKKQKSVVSNESADIVRMLPVAFADLAKRPLDLYPEDLHAEIDELNAFIYVALNNGSYKAGFSSNQDVYEAAYKQYFEALATLNERMSDGRRFLCGDRLTEADIRLYPTLYRHDPVYYNRFKLMHKKLWQYRHLWRWLVRMYTEVEGVKESGFLSHCKQGYYGRTGNNVVPLGPEDYPEPAYTNPDYREE